MHIEVITKQELETLKLDLSRLIEQEFKKLNKAQSIDYCLTTKEACKLLNVTAKTLQSYRDCKLISFTQVGSKIFYTKTDIDEFLDRFKIKSRLEVKSN
ncbi:helix-turn-helix domain-containing protein [Pontibacter sp. FD36]|uniref:helix-turn-helix domain-containing protein n=1 Tax=Pontibacter sp. FD36 TaxID=2789860 RepID=UPI0018AB930D|nr:helix-turn-helix domain-containing protein [Pontibacter sp. FD36]